MSTRWWRWGSVALGAAMAVCIVLAANPAELPELVWVRVKPERDDARRHIEPEMYVEPDGRVIVGYDASTGFSRGETIVALERRWSLREFISTGKGATIGDCIRYREVGRGPDVDGYRWYRYRRDD